MELEKPYYSISETAKIFKVNASLLRYWEKEFDVLKPYKNKKGDRYFSKKDIETIETIFRLTKEEGYTLQGAKDVIKHKKQSAIPSTDTKGIINKLLSIKERLLQLEQTI